MKLKDAIYGLAIGDALGVPYEFLKRGEFECTDMIGNGTHNQPEGTWTDDTSMTLATCMSIKNKKHIDVEDIRKEFEEWMFNNKYTPFDEVFDWGTTCSNAIYDKKGCDDEWSNGNGSLMRIIPLAFVNDITDEEIENVSAITHAHSISKEGCVYYVTIMDLLNLYELDDRDYSEAELIMIDAEGFATDEDKEVDYFGVYFKLIWMQLMYSSISYKKIKLRTLLWDFGYQRRTEGLINNMIRALNALSLVTYLKNYEVCNLYDAKLDDMIMIRLR